VTTTLNGFESGTNGSAIAATGSGGGTATVFGAVSGSLTYDNTHSQTGTLAAKIVEAASVADYVEWSTAIGTQTDIYGRAYLWRDALPASGTPQRFFGAFSSGTMRARVGVGSTGKVFVDDAASTQALVCTKAIPTGQWVCVEWHLTLDAVNGFADVRVYTGSSLYEEVTVSARNFGGSATQYRFGNVSATASGTAWLDDIGIDTASWLGSTGGIVVTPVGIASGETFGAASVTNNQLSNGFEHTTANAIPTNAANVTVGSTTSGEDAYDTVTVGTGNTMTYDNSQTAHGTFSAKVIATGTSQPAYVERTALGARTDVYGRIYFRRDATPSALQRLVTLVDSANAVCARIGWAATNKLAIEDSAAVTQATSTGTLAVDTWYRLEWHFVGDATAGAVTANVYLLDSTTVQSTLSTSYTAKNTRGAASKIRYGNAASVTVTGTLWVDDTAVNKTTFPGPYAAGKQVLSPLGIPAPGVTAWSGVTVRLGGASSSVALNPNQKVRSVLTNWNALQATETASSTGGVWATLDASILNAHNNNYQLILRILAGLQYTPLWVYTHATKPVPWTESKYATTDVSFAASFNVNVAPTFDPAVANQTNYPMPLPWNSGVAATPTTAQIQAAVDGSNLRFHYQNFLRMLSSWSNGPCPGNPAHTRSAHIFCTPCFMPTLYGSEMTTSDGNAVATTPTYARSAILNNTSPITGTASCTTAYKQAWARCIEDHRTYLPSIQFGSVAGGTMFGDGAASAMSLLNTYGPIYKSSILWMRTDLRTTYFTTFGKSTFVNSLANPNSPINFLIQAYLIGAGVAIQTAGDTLMFVDDTSANIAASLETAGTIMDTFIKMVEDLYTYVPTIQFFETSPSLDRTPATNGADFFTGKQYNPASYSGVGLYPPLGYTGWPGGTGVNAAGYLTSATGNLQSRITGTAIAPIVPSPTVTRVVRGRASMRVAGAWKPVSPRVRVAGVQVVSSGEVLSGGAWQN